MSPKYTNKMMKTRAINDYLFEQIILNTKERKDKVIYILIYKSGIKPMIVWGLTKESFLFEKGEIVANGFTFLIPKEFSKDDLQFFPINTTLRALQIKFKKNIKKIGVQESYSPLSLYVGWIINKLNEGYTIEDLMRKIGYSRVTLRDYSSRNLIDNKKRKKVLEKNDYKCVFCKRGPPEVKLHIDHIIPVSKGGTNDLSNLQVTCASCNLTKSNEIIDLKGVSD